MSAEAQRVAHGVVDVKRASLAHRVVEVALLIGLCKAGCDVDEGVEDGLNAYDELDTAGTSDQGQLPD